MIESNGDGKSGTATPDGRRRKKKTCGNTDMQKLIPVVESERGKPKLKRSEVMQKDTTERDEYREWKRRSE